MQHLENLGDWAYRLPIQAVQAALPFSILDEFGLPCAYERSIKISPSGIFANRYLLGMDTRIVTKYCAGEICQRLSMPRYAQLQFMKRFDRASMFYIGYEDSRVCSTYKVYVEYPAKQRHQSISHVGWKWPITSEVSNELVRRTLYQRVCVSNIAAHLDLVASGYQFKSNPSRLLVSHVLQSASHAMNKWICLRASEENGRLSYDWNLYPANLFLDQFREPLIAISTSYNHGCEEMTRFLDIAPQRAIGHVSGGIDARGEEFCSLYYLSAST